MITVSRCGAVHCLLSAIAEVTVSGIAHSFRVFFFSYPQGHTFRVFSLIENVVLVSKMWKPFTAAV